MVLGRCPDHRGSTDVYVLDGLVIARSTRNGFLKRVKVHDQQIDRTDPVLLHRRYMFRFVAQCEQSAMYGRVQRLDAPIHHFRKARDVRHIRHVQASISQHSRRSTGAQQRNTARGKALGKIKQASFVRNGNECALWRHEIGHGIRGSFGAGRAGNVVSSRPEGRRPQGRAPSELHPALSRGSSRLR